MQHRLAKRAHCAALLLMVLVPMGCGTEAVPRLRHVPADATILAFGDSLTYGTGAQREESYPAILSTMIGRTVVNAGVPGETSAQGLVRLPQVLDETRPALVLLCLGGNDMLRRQERQRMHANLDAMVTEIRSRGIDVVLLAVPEPALLALSPEPGYELIARRVGIPLQPDVITEVLADRNLRSDQIHPNARGYRMIAEAVARLLQQAGAV